MAATITLIVASGFVAYAATTSPNLIGLGGSSKATVGARKGAAKSVTVNQITYVDDTVVVTDSSAAVPGLAGGPATDAPATDAPSASASAASSSGSAAAPRAGAAPASTDGAATTGTTTPATTGGTTTTAPSTVVPTTTTRAPAGTAPTTAAPTTAAPTTAAPTTTTTVARPTTTVPPRTTVSGQIIPAGWEISSVYNNKPIPSYPAGCKNGQLEDNGTWNCQ